MLPKLKVLFLCTGNACRSQLAEGWARTLHADRLEACSAGLEPAGLDPRAVEVMGELGVDISGQRSKHVDEFAGSSFDCVVTVCAGAEARCPSWPGVARRLHAGFDDPPRLAANAGTGDAALAPYRRVRDEIRSFVAGLPAALESASEGERP